MAHMHPSSTKVTRLLRGHRAPAIVRAVMHLPSKHANIKGYGGISKCTQDASFVEKEMKTFDRVLVDRPPVRCLEADSAVFRTFLPPMPSRANCVDSWCPNRKGRCKWGLFQARKGIKAVEFMSSIVRAVSNRIKSDAEINH